MKREKQLSEVAVGGVEVAAAAARMLQCNGPPPWVHNTLSQ